MKKYTFTTALIGFILFGVTTNEFWLGLAIASLLLTPVLQGIVGGWQGKPKEKITTDDNVDLDGVFKSPIDDLYSWDPTNGNIASPYDKDGNLRW